MAPIIAKLICNNKDAIRQRDEDVELMKDLARNQFTNIAPPAAHQEVDLASKNSGNDELLEIAEKIRELAIKLQIQKDRLNSKSSNKQLNDTLTIGLQHIQEVMARTPTHSTKDIVPSIQQALLEHCKNLSTTGDDAWFNDIVTPKAGNLSIMEEKTPLHSNLSRRHLTTGSSKDKVANVSAMYHNPYPITRSKTSQQKQNVPVHKTLDVSLANLREKIQNSKCVEYHNDNHNVKHNTQRRPLSTRSHRSISVSRVQSFHTLQTRHENQEFPSTEAGQKRRSVSAGRAAQHGKQLINRILRRDEPYETCNNALTASSSDVTPDQDQPVPVPTTRREALSLDTNETLHIVVNPHYNSKKNEDTNRSNRNVSSKTPRNTSSNNDDNALDRRVWNATKQIFRRADTPTQQRRGISSPSKLAQKIRSISPFKSSKLHQEHQVENIKRPIIIDPSISSSTVSISSDQRYMEQRRAPRNGTEKGFEIIISDDPKQPLMKNHRQEQNLTSNNSRTRHSTGSVTSTNSSSNMDRAAMIERLQERQRIIKQRLRNDLVVSTDHIDNDDDNDKNHNCNNIKSNTISTRNKQMLDSTRATILMHSTRNDSQSVVPSSKTTTMKATSRQSTVHTAPKKVREYERIGSGSSSSTDSFSNKHAITHQKKKKNDNYHQEPYNMVPVHKSSSASSSSASSTSLSTDHSTSKLLKSKVQREIIRE